MGSIARFEGSAGERNYQGAIYGWRRYIDGLEDGLERVAAVS
jgi:hypothetical protein